MRLHNSLAIIIIIISSYLTEGCTKSAYERKVEKAFPRVIPKWNGAVKKIDPGLNLKFARLEFSSDNALLCYYSDFTFPHKNIGAMDPWPIRRVYDLKGNLVDGALDNKMFFTPEYLSKFNRSVPRSSTFFKITYAQDKEYYAKSIMSNAGDPEIIAKSLSWVVSNDSQEMLILKKDEKGDDAFLPTSKCIELWRLEPEVKLLWAKELPDTMSEWRAANISNQGENRKIFFADSSNFYLVNHDDGNIMDYHDYGRNSRAADAVDPKLVKPEVSLKEFDRGFYFNFMGAEADVDNKNSLFSAGVNSGRRVKIISLTKPFSTVIDLNKLENPLVWSVQRVEFVGENYLLVGYMFGSAGLQLYPTDIFDVRTGKLVWRENCDEIEGVTLSPDGKTIAFIRNGMIEIGDFFP